MYKMTVQMPNLPKGTKVAIDGLGIFENGYEYDVSAEEAENYRSRNTVQTFHHDDEGNLIVETEIGPTLLQTTKKYDGIDVVKMSSEELEAFKKSVEEDPVVVEPEPATVTPTVVDENQSELPLEIEGDDK